VPEPLTPKEESAGTVRLDGEAITGLAPI